MSTAYDRCHCRPGCLAAVINGDDVVLGVDGYALIQHVMACPVDQLVLDVEEQAS